MPARHSRGGLPAIGALFAEGEIPGEVAAAIARAYARTPGRIRPSPCAHRPRPRICRRPSFAGQQDTYLNVSGSGQVLAAVKRCWASLWTARAIGYRLRHGIDQEIVSLAVVVQTLVPAEAAGILFTANPMSGAGATGDGQRGLGPGRGDRGRPGDTRHITVTRPAAGAGARDRRQADHDRPRSEGGTEEQPVPEELRRAPVLDDGLLPNWRAGVQIESLYGMPMDIEWTLTDGALAIVQARPITALPDAPAPRSSPQRGRCPIPKDPICAAASPT